EYQIARECRQIAVAGAVERHTGIALKRGRDEPGERIAASDHGIVGPGGAAVGRDMKEHLVEVAPEVVAHDDPRPGGRIDCRADLGFWPGIAVLIHLHVVEDRRRTRWRHTRRAHRRLLM